MTRILLLGETPPFLLGERKIEAAHYRTWQFLEPLLDDGHEILLCAPPVDTPLSPVPSRWNGRLHVRPVNFYGSGWVPDLQRIHDEFRPACVIATNTDFCIFATRLRADLPLWMDFYGDPLTIMQAAAYRAGNDRGLNTYREFVTMALRRGDCFSVCGGPQGHMLVGELAMAGRLNAATFGYDFAHVVLPGAPPALAIDPPTREVARERLLQLGVPGDAFVVLWAGGYNTWTDVETLFTGLSRAMDRDPRVVYVSVGASTYAAADSVYGQLQQLVADSPHRQRFFLLGWRPWTEMAGFYRASDAGINIDAAHYETLYGTRTRLVEMISLGLPVITSFGPELSYLLADAGAAQGFRIGDADGLAEAILELATNPACALSMAQAAERFARETLSFAVTTALVRQWANEPLRAPDSRPHSAQEKARALEYGLRGRVRRVLWRMTGAYR